MIYTPLTKKAMTVCYRQHAGRTDKSGLPYVFHPFHVAEQMKDEASVTVALLHDVIEDGTLSAEDLLRDGFPSEVVDALKLLTHDKSTAYEAYVDALKTNPLARRVKLADLRHNSDLTRLDAVTEADKARRKKYLSAIRVLKAYEKEEAAASGRAKKEKKP